MQLWAYAGDALWVLALTIMTGLSRHAWSRIPPGVAAPMLGGRLNRGLAVWALPVGAFLISLYLAYAARAQATEGEPALMLFGVRALAASGAALLHLNWLGGALRQLAKEGALRP
jgi:hypothetical protein